MQRLGLLVAAVAFGCGGSEDFESAPIDVAGVYSVNVTNKVNGCGFPNWKEGEQTTGIELTMMQDGTSVTGAIGGGVGALVQLLLGASTFSGTLSGDQVTATNFGTKSATQNGCTYTTNMVMTGTLTGDALQGVLEYTPQTNGSPDCGVLNECTSLQEFSGARPPK
jgi:hypothetical protein